MEQALAICDPPAEILPPELREKYGILPAETAYRAIHQPQTMEEAAQAKKRMIFEEFFVFSAGLSLMRASRAEKQVIPYTQLDLTEFYQALPFELTGAQKRAIGDILADFRNVRGEFDSDSQVAAVRETRQRVARIAEEVVSAL